MRNLGTKIAQKRKHMGMTQIAFAESLSVSRQTVSRWEAGSVMPEIDKICEIAKLLHVSCDYLLKDEVTQDEVTRDNESGVSGVSRLLSASKGKTVRLTFFEDEIDLDLMNQDCKIVDFEGNWMKVLCGSPKQPIEKLISLSSVLSFEIKKEGTEA